MYGSVRCLTATLRTIRISPWDVQDAQDDDRQRIPSANDRDDDDRNQQSRKGEHEVDHPGDDQIETSAEVTGRDADGG